MTARDRMVLIVLGALLMLGAAYMLLVSPEQKQASQVAAKVVSARSELSAAQTKLAEAQQAEKRYAAAYSSIVSLGEAVPAETEVPSLIYQLDHATSKDHVSFESIAASAAGGGSSSSSSSASASAASIASAGFQQLPFTFTFVGSYEQLYQLMGRLQSFTVSKPDGSVNVDGRLLSVEGLTLNVNQGESGSGSGSAQSSQLTASVTATAYVLPPGSSLTSGASPSAPTGASPAASGSSAAPTTTPAVVRPLR